MSLLSKVAISNLKENKYKSVLLIITIVLLTIILTIIGIICCGLDYKDYSLYSNTQGSFQAIYKGVSYEDALKIKSSKYLDNVGIGNDYAISVKNNGVELHLMYLDSTLLDLLYFESIEGRLPEGKNEIAIEEKYLKSMGKTYKIGDNIEISYDEEVSGKSGKEVFKIVGLLEKRDIKSEGTDCLGVISSKLIDKGKNNFNTYINLRENDFLSEFKVTEKLINIAKKIEIENYNIKINYEYIIYQRHTFSRDIFIISIVLIILVLGAIAIYSIFNISTILNVKEFGKLGMLGATKRQIQGILLREAFLVACISIPIGLFIGYCCSKIILLKIFKINSSIESLIKILIGVVIIILLTVIVSIIIPTRRAKDISPVEATKFNDKLNCGVGKRGILAINIKTLTCNKIFGYKNKIDIILIPSLISGVLIMTLSILLLSLEPEELARREVNGDFNISIKHFLLPNNEFDFTKGDLGNSLGEKLIEKIENLPGVVGLNTEKIIIAEVIGKENNIKKQVIKEEFERQIYNIQDMWLKGRINYDELIDEKGIIIGSSKLANDLGVKVNDNITITFYDGNKKINKDFLVKYICKNESQCIIVPSELISNLEHSGYSTSIAIEIDDNYYYYIKDYLKKLAYNNDNLVTKDLRIINTIYDSNYKVVKSLVYLLISIVSIICAMNHVNIMTTGIIVRKREVGILQAIGLSKRQLVKMFKMESLFYTNISIIVILFFGNIYAYAILWVLRFAGIKYLEYKFSFMLIFLVSCILLIGHIILSCIVTAHFYKKSLIEQLRYK